MPDIAFALDDPVQLENCIKGSFTPFSATYKLTGYSPKRNTAWEFRYRLAALEGKYNSVLFECSTKLSVYQGLSEPCGTRAMSSPAQGTNSIAALEQIQDWLQMCIKTHERCGPGQDSPLPRRVIDVLSLEVDHRVRLRELYNHEQGKYICLSHCWGTEEAIPLRTTLETYEERMTGIIWSDLPKTFQDTINLARQLSVRYVWIDSLCIIQDDPIDWQKEAAMMESIYSGSFLTVAATAASNSHVGLHSDIKSSNWFKYIKKEYTGARMDVWAHEAVQHVNDISIADEFPLLSRAWCYQERMLSPRVLHFVDQEMSWECRQGAWCECGEARGTLADKSTFETKLINLERHLSDGDPDNGKRSPASRKIGSDTPWSYILLNFPRLKLSFSGDLFPSLAGLARRVQETTGDVYLAGLWKSNFLYQLSWSTQAALGQQLMLRRPKKWRAPTWSWASVVGAEFIWQREGSTEKEVTLAKIIEVICEPLGEDPLGALKNARLMISGKLLPMTLKDNNFSLNHSQSTQCSIQGFGTAIEADTSLWLELDYETWKEGPYHVPFGTEVYVLPLFKDRGGVISLLLRRLDGKSRVYERIGHLSGEWKAFANHLDESDCEDKYLEERCITIV